MEIVPFEIAQKLKEKGFYYKCFATYDKDGMLGYNYVQPEKHCAIGFDDCLCSNNIEDNGCIDAPTISQVLKWLREKKIYVSVEVEREDWFEYKIVQTIKNTRMNSTKVYETYLEAILAGIEYVLDNDLI